MKEQVLRSKYILASEKCADDMHRRLAKEIARIDGRYPKPKSEQEFYSWLKDFQFIVPQGSIMYGTGRNSPVSLSNCFVIGLEEDSYGAIMKADEELVQIAKRRGGVGFDLSNIRPKGAKVDNSAHSATGVVSFMHRFSNSCREVGQDGRRGALMLTLSIEHPDAEEFIKAKADLTAITGANISIRFTDAFMKKVVEKEDFIQRFDNGKGCVVTKRVYAPALWNEFVKQAHATAEPGAIFWDNIVTNSPADCYEGFKTASTNPLIYWVA
jgi:ribonucleoside-diphosphate reductase alpha chain